MLGAGGGTKTTNGCHFPYENVNLGSLMTLQLGRWCGATFGLKVAQILEKLLFFTRSATHPRGALSGTHPRAGISEGKTINEDEGLQRSDTPLELRSQRGGLLCNL